jgi:hypothetical protein
MNDKHGCNHAMQNPSILAKKLKSGYNPKNYEFPSGKIIQIYGYEGFCVDILLKKGVSESEIVTSVKRVPKIMYNIEGEPNGRRYFMDIYIPRKDRAIEVKSVYTYNCDKEKNQAKWIETSKVCKGGIDIYIFDEKGTFLARKRILDGKVIRDTYCIGNKPGFVIPIGKIY